ncbi:MAG TPA: hypothetical protein VKA64_06595, partial [Gammaproteobacteria bacterium]|nr:hypothetical protein [Gammaproteobacteria bacterium]
MRKLTTAFPLIALAGLLVALAFLFEPGSAPAMTSFHAAATDPRALAGAVMLMGNLSPSGVRVIDPILSSVVQGYRQPDLVGEVLFPRIPVTTRGGQVIEFGTEAFMLYNARRAPGANTKRVEFGYQGKPFALVEDSLEGKVPREYLRDAQRVPGINLGTRTVNLTMRSLLLALENEQATLARGAANYDASHKIDLSGAKWSNDANNPSSDIETGREAIRASCGM